jgi:hypothetical protein
MLFPSGDQQAFQNSPEGIERLFPDDSPARRMYRLFGVPWLKDDARGPLLSSNPPT